MFNINLTISIICCILGYYKIKFMEYVVGIGCSFTLASIVAFFWVRGINHMKENHPNYKGGDLFGEFDDEDEKHIG